MAIFYAIQYMGVDQFYGAGEEEKFSYINIEKKKLNNSNNQNRGRQ
jgi:hypothetical protein